MNPTDFYCLDKKTKNFKKKNVRRLFFNRLLTYTFILLTYDKLKFFVFVSLRVKAVPCFSGNDKSCASYQAVFWHKFIGHLAKPAKLWQCQHISIVWHAHVLKNETTEKEKKIQPDWDKGSASYELLLYKTTHKKCKSCEFSKKIVENHRSRST